MTNQSTLRDRIFVALTRLQENETNYPHRPNRNGDPLPQCHFCGEVGLFVTGNGGITHMSECATQLIHRIPKETNNLNFFDQLAYKSLLRQIATFTQYPCRKQEPFAPGRTITIWQPFCPFCKSLPHQTNCIVALAQAELEQQGGQA